MRWKVVGTVSVGLAMVGSVGLIGLPADAAPAPQATARSAGTHAVTLITGDHVLLVDRADGQHEVTVQPGAGRAGMQFLRRTGKDAAGRDDLQVVPVDAVSLLAA